MIVLQHDFVFFQIGRLNDPHPIVCIIGNVSGNNTEEPIEIDSFRTLFETVGTVDKPTWRAVHKALLANARVLLFDRTDHFQAIFDIAASDWEGAHILRVCIDGAKLTVERLKAAHFTFDNNLIGEPGGEAPTLTIDPPHYHFEYPYEPPKSEVERKPKKQHGPQSRRQWWNR